MRPLDILRNLTALYVEDDPEQREQLSELLRGFFLQLHVTDNGTTGLELFERNSIHLVITDIRTPGMSGLEMARAIRERDAKVPILITSAFAETSDLLTSVRLHMVDYLLKPLSWSTLKGALEAGARQIEETGRWFVRIDADTSYFPLNGSVVRHGEQFTLTPRERALLEFLAAHRGVVVAKERIFTRVYPDRFEVSEVALKNLVFKLRRKIGDDAVSNTYGAGYMLKPALADIPS